MKCKHEILAKSPRKSKEDEDFQKFSRPNPAPKVRGQVVRGRGSENFGSWNNGNGRTTSAPSSRFQVMMAAGGRDGVIIGQKQPNDDRGNPFSPLPIKEGKN